MTRVTLLRGADGRLAGFTCKGHSGFAQAGSDIVCAAVSALSITCANSLESVAGVSPETEERDGYLSVRVPSDRMTHDAEIVLKVFEAGITDIAATYPKHIQITTR